MSRHRRFAHYCLGFQMTDFRALCAELTDELHGYASANPHHDSDELVVRARTALAPQPVPEGPSTDELHQVFHDYARDFCKEKVLSPGRFCVAARAVLARWGTPNLAQVRSSVGDGPAVQSREPASVKEDLTEPPADGEVAELVEFLRHEAQQHADSWPDASAKATRLADFVERLDKPVPVWPSDEDLVELACAEVYNSRNWEEPECTTDDPYPYEASSFAWLNFARAVLARWGQP